MLPNKNCGYAKYANANSAQNAIQTLNGAEICGVKLKVNYCVNLIFFVQRHKKFVHVAGNGSR